MMLSRMSNSLAGRLLLKTKLIAFRNSQKKMMGYSRKICSYPPPNSVMDSLVELNRALKPG